MISNQENILNPSEDKGGAIYPKEDCPHYKNEWLQKYLEVIKKTQDQFIQQECNQCKNIGENWICMACGEVKCSRYVQAHMSSHNQASQHPVALSFSDGSFWCYSCDSYITNRILSQCRKIFEFAKFNNIEKLSQAIDDIETIQLDEQLKDVHIKDEQQSKQEFSRQKFIDGIKNNQFKRIVIFSGAGISVSSGIPDFRSPDTGIYSQLKQFNLPYPELVFELSYFKKNPKPFYVFTKSILEVKPSPTINHYFINEINKSGQLLMNFTQNIDSLEIDAGIPQNKVIFAHGNYLGAACTLCGKDASIEEFKKCVMQDQIYKCSSSKCQGYIKPNIIFFGEPLPYEFFMNAGLIKSCDIAIVMGTSLKVQPFASLIGLVGDDVPIVLINRENPGIIRKKFLFIEGDLDNNVQKLMEELGWEFPKIEKKLPQKMDFQIDKQLNEEVKQEEDINKKQLAEKNQEDVTKLVQPVVTQNLNEQQESKQQTKQEEKNLTNNQLQNNIQYNYMYTKL